MEEMMITAAQTGITMFLTLAALYFISTREMVWLLFTTVMASLSGYLAVYNILKILTSM